MIKNVLYFLTYFAVHLYVQANKSKAIFSLLISVINFTSKGVKFNKLCHKIEDLLYNCIDEITTENIRAIIDDYDTINEQIEYPFVGYIKERLIKKYGSNRIMPNCLNCVSDLVVSKV